jgi:hypothetical protein
MEGLHGPLGKAIGQAPGHDLVQVGSALSTTASLNTQFTAVSGC